jgi:hypothetical protein
LTPWAVDSPDAALDAIENAQLVISCGPPGVTLLGAGAIVQTPGLQAAIDLNAVPPSGIADIKAADSGVQRGDVICYGALGIGAAKMKIHKAAIARLFTANDLVLDADEVYELGRSLER